MSDTPALPAEAPLPAGTLLSIVVGDAIDTTHLIVARTLRDVVSFPALRQEWANTFEMWRKECGLGEATQFVRWLLENGWLEETPMATLHLDPWISRHDPGTDELIDYRPASQTWWWDF